MTPDKPEEPALSTFQIPALNESSSIPLGMDFQGSMERHIEPMTDTGNQYPPSPGGIPDVTLDNDPAISWEMIGLGLEEPLPTQEAVNEL